MPFVYFIVMVGVLVLVHELGHFLMAKLFGVRVLRFSIGFGPRIAGFQRGGTEYVLSALPLGGYVSMLGENPRDVVQPCDRQQSFANQSLFRRVAIIVGGPLMNLMFPIALYFVVFLGDTRLTPATVGRVYPNLPATGKLLAGDRVTAIDGEEIEVYDDLNRTVERSPGKALKFTIERGGARIEQVITPIRVQKVLPLDVHEEVGRIGVGPYHPMPVIGVTDTTSPAAAARLRTFDVIVAAAGRPIDRWIDFERVLSGNRGTLVPLSYLRPTPLPSALGGMIELAVHEPRVATLTPEPGEGSALARAGIEIAELYVSDVTAGSPEHRLGLLPGDRLLELDGKPIQLWATFLEDLRAGGGREHSLSWQRGDKIMSGRYALEHEQGVNEHGQVYDHYDTKNVLNWLPQRTDERVPNPHPVLYAAREALRATTEVVDLTLFSILRLLQGRLSVKSIGGPLTIFDAADTAAREGALDYLALMAFISINLGLINLLPIPLLDGGHLMFLLSEAVLRRPLSVRVREYAHIAGLLALLAIMVVAFKNDIERQWPQIVDQLMTD